MALDVGHDTHANAISSQHDKDSAGTMSNVNGLWQSRRHFTASGIAGLGALLGASRAGAAVGGAQLAAGDMRAGTTPGAEASALIVNVRDFGARGDGVSDDAPAINAAIRAVREHHKKVGPYDVGCRIVFPAAVYAVNSSIDLTGLRQINTVIDGGGAAIVGRCAGKPVIDALGTRWLTVRDLTLLGDPASVPTIGIQIGLLSPNIVADDHRFENVKVLGHFARACLYNRAAETSSFDHVLLWNDHLGSHCLIQDGVNHFGITSQFAACDVPVDTGLSFNEDLFTNCDFRHGAGGTPVWLGDTARHAFVRCYAATDAGPSFIIYSGQNGHLMLEIDCHVESDKLHSVFLFTGRSDRVVVRGFSYRDHCCFASESVFRCDTKIVQVELQNARLEVASFWTTGCQVFAQPDRWRATGSFYTTNAGHWNGDGIFTGMLTIGSEVRFTGPLPISVRVPERPVGGNPSVADEGGLYRDKATNRLLVWTGRHWVDALGNPA